VETEHSDQLDSVLGRIKGRRRSGLPEEPLVVIDDTGLFHENGYLNKRNLHDFQLGTRPKNDTSPTLLFICSAGPPLTEPPPDNCHRIVVSEDAWQAAWGLKREVESYLNPGHSRGA
jgi:hypothetical protein